MDVLFNLVLTFVGVAAALWYESLGSPRLLFSAGETTDSVQSIGQRCRFLHLQVTNRPRRAPLVRRQSASSCHGTITFLSGDRRWVSGQMPVRWVDAPQPVRQEIVNGQAVGVLEPNLLRVARFMDIPPGETESCDIAIRIDGDTDAYGWTPDSYRHGWRHPSFRLPTGDFIAQVALTTGDSVFRTEIHFRNPTRFDGFDLVR
jgi:hypothetical protein